MVSFRYRAFDVKIGTDHSRPESIGVLLLLLLSVVVELVEGNVGPRGGPARFFQPLPHHSWRNAVRILKNIIIHLISQLHKFRVPIHDVLLLT